MVVENSVFLKEKIERKILQKFLSFFVKEVMFKYLLK